MLIQIILLLIVAVIAIRLAVKFKAKEISGREFFGWLFIWLVSAVIIIWPEVTVWLANSVGVGRGSDLVIYLGMIFLFYSVFRVFLRLEKIEKNLTKLVSQEALRDYDEHK